MAQETELARSAEGAERSIRPRWPMMASSHPYVIAVYRKYYLQIEQINEETFKKWNAKDEIGGGQEEADWGVTDEDEEEETSEPEEILWERLRREQPVLSKFLHPLLSVEPIGFELRDEPVWNEAAAARPPVAGLIIHNVERGIKRLLAAPRDLSQAWARPEEPITKDKAAETHLRLFARYQADLKRTVNEAIYAWSRRISAMQERQGISQKQAVDAAYDVHLGGPAGSRHIIWVVRKYWLACEAANQGLPQKQWVPPEVFLIGWLLGHEYEEEVEVLAQLPFWPIGLDRSGNWV